MLSGENLAFPKSQLFKKIIHSIIHLFIFRLKIQIVQFLTLTKDGIQKYVLPLFK